MSFIREKHGFLTSVIAHAGVTIGFLCIMFHLFTVEGGSHFISKASSVLNNP